MTVDGLDASSSSQRSPGVRRAVSLVLLRIVEVAMEGKCPPAGGAVEFERQIREGHLLVALKGSENMKERENG